MSAPDRAARLWLAVAVAPLWMGRVGGALEVGPGPEATELPDLRPWWGLTVATPGRPRRLRLLRLGVHAQGHRRPRCPARCCHPAPAPGGVYGTPQRAGAPGLSPTCAACA
jgi:hypothetical protein